MSCHQANYSITVGGLVDDQELSFETASSIKVTFNPPQDQRVTGVSFLPDPPPSGYPAPTTTTDSITFSNPSGGTTDFSVVVSHATPTMMAQAGPLGIETPSTTIIFKPRTTCPT